MVCAPVWRDNRPFRCTNHALSHLYTITSVDLAQYGVSRAKDWVSVDCGTISVVFQRNMLLPPLLSHEKIRIIICNNMFVLET